jgi:acyl transferase domain-containing protein
VTVIPLGGSIAERFKRPTRKFGASSRDSTTHLRESLEEFINRKGRHALANVKSAKGPEVAFLFTGQGGEVVGLGRQLFETETTFRTAIERCDGLLRPYLPQGFFPFLYANTNAGDLDASHLQPALFALQYSLTELWRSWGVVPSLVVGHSLGEYAAAYAAGIFSLEDGIKLVAKRARLMHGLSHKGRMAVVLWSSKRLSRT